MKNISDILYEKNILAMFPKIQIYYQEKLGIQVAPETMTLSRKTDNKEVEENVIYPHRIVNESKIPKKCIDIPSSEILDSSELLMVLTTHFDEVLTKSKPSLQDLVAMKNYITELKAQYLDYNFLDEHPEGSVIVRFMDGLYCAIIQKIKEHLYERLSNSDNFEPTLIHPLQHDLNELKNILAHCDISDLINFQTVIANLLTTHSDDEDFAHTLQGLANTIEERIKKNVDYLLMHVDDGILTERLPTLKSQIQIKHWLGLQGKSHPPFDELLEKNIKINILNLLRRCESEINAALLDPKKKQKQELVGALKDLCNDTNDSNVLYQKIISNGNLLKSQPIGRYLYECIYWLLNIKISGERYSLTLFQTVELGVKDLPGSKEESKLKPGKI